MASLTRLIRHSNRTNLLFHLKPIYLFDNLNYSSDSIKKVLVANRGNDEKH